MRQVLPTPPEPERSAMTAALFFIALNVVLIGSLGIRRES